MARWTMWVRSRAIISALRRGTWLDTLAIGPNQTHRIAFKAEAVGQWLIESMAADWAAPRLIRHYVVE